MLGDDAVSKVQKSMAFVVPFAKALVKLRRAETEGKGVLLNKDEVKAVVDGFRLLKEHNR